MMYGDDATDLITFSTRTQPGPCACGHRNLGTALVPCGTILRFFYCGKNRVRISSWCRNLLVKTHRQGQQEDASS